MVGDVAKPEIQISKKQILKIFMKTGRKRVLLSVLCGILIFLGITSLMMVIYNHRFNNFIDYQNSIDWFNDDELSIKSIRYFSNEDSFYNGYLENFTNEYVSKLNNLFIGLELGKFYSAFSLQLYQWRFEPGNPDPWHYYEIMATDNITNNALTRCVVEGRMPQNTSELVYFNIGEDEFDVNDTITFHHFQNVIAYTTEFTIVGVVENIHTIFNNESLSTDLFDWSFDRDNYSPYTKEGLFFTNNTIFDDLAAGLDSYYGKMTTLVDVEYDCRAFALNNLNSYIDKFPGQYFVKISTVTGSEIALASDLKLYLVEFINIWTTIFSRINAINAPLFFLIGLISLVTLSIGSKELTHTFRRMKLYGLDYKVIRQIVFVENLIFTVFSFIVGCSLGFLIGYLFTYNNSNLTDNFYSQFLLEPIFSIAIGTMIIGFFSISFILQNGLAKKTARTADVDYKVKRRKIRMIFSTNEFRLFVVALIFSVISAVLYIAYYFFGPAVPALSNFSYISFFWFMIALSVTFIITFAFLLVTRLITLLWTLISRLAWRRNLNFLTLSIKHLSDNKGIYQITIVTALTFGILIFPGLSMQQSIPVHLSHETKLSMGYANLVVRNWLDPEDELNYSLII